MDISVPVLFHDWNDPGEKDGRVKAYLPRHYPTVEVPSEGTRVIVGCEDVFFEATVDERQPPRFAVVSLGRRLTDDEWADLPGAIS